ncbi:MAG: c-type cytochrome [Gammaproteobacteria bacterium]|nr:c-type cytochrome [Gammaproteobacteria bacterium]MBQ0839472.1 c-type cytochrome [Gammaproteobacteria bacterium]
MTLLGCSEKASSPEKQSGAAGQKPSGALMKASADGVKHELFSVGQPATQAQIEGWDIDVRPDGLGLPEGEGSVEDGEMLYEDKCASCHGTFGEGEGRWPKLAGGMGTLSQERPDKTVGSYWPYASTLWDYIRRAMPFPAPQSLAVDEVYAITAYVLNLNDLVDDDFVLSRDNFNSIKMPNKDGFFIDDRPDVKNPRCLSGCLDPATIKIVETIAGITPTAHIKEGGTDARAYSEEEAGGDNTEAQSAGKSVHDSACKICHGSGVAGAPITGNSDDWQARIKQDKALIYQHALEGFQGESGVMPAKGGQTQLDDIAVKAAVDYMLEQSH